MDYLVKIEKKGKYLRIALPSKVVEKTGFGSCDLAKIRIKRNNILEVECIDSKNVGKTKVPRGTSFLDS